MIDLTLLMSNVEFVGSFALNGIVMLKVSSIENTILSLISSKEKVIQLNVNPFNKK